MVNKFTSFSVISIDTPYSSGNYKHFQKFTNVWLCISEEDEAL